MNIDTRHTVYLIGTATICLYITGIISTSFYLVWLKPSAFFNDSDNKSHNQFVEVSQMNVAAPVLTSRRSNSSEEFPWWDGGECSNRTPIIYDKEVKGHCGRRASVLGPSQKVVSMCIYGKKNVYYKGIQGNLNRMKEVYPGYVLRLYLNPRLYKEQLCPLLKKFEHLYICDITNLPAGLGNISDINPRGWRYAPMGDPQVEITLVRDSEVTILNREVDAVAEWLGTRTTLHVMKDIPISTEGHPIMAGCWGLRSDLDKMYSADTDMRIKLNMLRKKMFEYMKNKHSRFNDQDALRDILYPVLRTDMVRHDSFFCQKYPGSRPFPTQRNGTREFVGQAYYRPPPGRNLKCPVECRPPNHQDWKYC